MTIYHRMTRRNILVGAAASLISAPGIVRAASLMPVRGMPLQILNPKRKIPKTVGEWYRLCFHNNLDNELRAGRAMTTVLGNGQIISVAEAHRMVAHARLQGWLPPYSTIGKPANVPLLKNGASVSGL